MRRKFDIRFPVAAMTSTTGGHGRRHYLCCGLRLWVRKEVILLSPIARVGDTDGETIVLPRDPEILEQLARDLLAIAEETRK